MYSLPPAETSHPAPLLLRKLRDGTFSSSFYLYSHTPDDIAIAVQYCVRPPPDGLTNDQQQALATYNKMRNKTVSDFDNQKQFTRLLHEYLHIFQKAFFFGALENHCKLRVRADMHGLLGVTFGYRTHVVQDDLTRLYELEIGISNLRDDLRYADPQERLDGYLVNLLHEALHARFALYTCRFDTLCRQRCLNSVGAHGHKSAWETTARAIERVTEDLRMTRSRSRLETNIDQSVGIHRNHF